MVAHICITRECTSAACFVLALSLKLQVVLLATESVTSLPAKYWMDAFFGCTKGCTVASAFPALVGFSMPLVLNYRFTVIDAEDNEEAAQGVQLRRALTPPPPRPGHMSQLGEAAHSEGFEVARCRDYLKGLMRERGLVDSGKHGRFKRMSDGSKDFNDASVDEPSGASE